MFAAPWAGAGADAASQSDDPTAGLARYWSVAGAAGQVIVQIGFGIPHFRIFVECLASHLTAQGFAGPLRLYAPTRELFVPRHADLIESRLKVRADLTPRTPRPFPESPVKGSWDRLLNEAVGWCTQLSGAGLSLEVHTMPQVGLDDTIDVCAVLVSAIEDDELDVVSLIAGGPAAWRILTCERAHSRLTLIEGGAHLDADGWRDPLASQLQFLRAGAPNLAYAFIKRGTAVSHARVGDSLATDWPHRSGFLALARQESPCEDWLAPDGFGAQLLGPGFDNFLPDEQDWVSSSVGSSTLITHRQPEDWFRAPFIPLRGGYRQSLTAAAPDVLHRARTAFAPIIFFDEPAGGSAGQVA